MGKSWSFLLDFSSLMSSPDNSPSSCSVSKKEVEESCDEDEDEDNRLCSWDFLECLLRLAFLDALYEIDLWCFHLGEEARLEASEEESDERGLLDFLTLPLEALFISSLTRAETLASSESSRSALPVEALNMGARH